MFRKILALASLAGLLTGCALPGSTSVPTPYPANILPTVIYLTAESLNGTMSAQTAAATTPTATPTPTLTPIPPTPVPTETATPAPGVPLAAIQISAPGPMSRVASPLEIRMTAVAGKSRIIQISLFGEDGRKLNSILERVPSYGGGVYIFEKIPFEIRAAGESGLIQVSTKDEFHRVQSLVSVPILLISSGASQINPPGNNIYERVVLYNLRPDSTISGGVLDVSGQFQPYNHQPVILELVSNDGKSLGLRVLTFPNLGPQSFTTTVPYKVSKPTPARLIIRQADNVLTDPAYVYSQELMLNR